MSESARTYTVSHVNQTILGGATLIFINPDTDVGIEILRCWIGQEDETAEQIRCALFGQGTTFPTLTAITPRPHLWAAPASKIVAGTAGAAGTCGANASAEGGGAKTAIVQDSFNNLNGYLWLASPEERIIFRAGATSGFGMRIVTTPTTLSGWNFGVTFREI